MRIQRRIVWTGGAMAATVVLAGCGGSGSAYGSGSKVSPAQSAAGGNYGTTAPQTSPTAVAAAPKKWTKLTVTTDGSLGKILVSAKGWTLYRFDGDTAKPSATHCVAACAKAWPPVVWTGKVQGAGLKSALFGKIKRPDGTWQVTLNGWPLYRFAKDTTPGETLGQGVKGKWYVSTPIGKKAKAAAKSGSGGSGSTSGSSGYGY